MDGTQRFGLLARRRQLRSFRSFVDVVHHGCALSEASWFPTDPTLFFYVSDRSDRSDRVGLVLCIVSEFLHVPWYQGVTMVPWYAATLRSLLGVIPRLVLYQ